MKIYNLNSGSGGNSGGNSGGSSGGNSGNSGGSGGSFYTPPTRQTKTIVTPSLTDQETHNVSVTGFKSYAILEVSSTTSAWVRIYTSDTTRTNDATRTQYTDTMPGSGVIAEFMTISTNTIEVTPVVIGFVNPASTTIPIAVTNISGSDATISVSLTLLQLES